MRCDSCNKFVSFDTDNDPEEQGNDFDEVSGSYNLDYRITNNCAECGQELKEATFQFEGQVPEEIVKEHTGNYEKIDKETGEVQLLEHTLEMDVDVSRGEKSEGKGRYAKSFYGMTAEVTITCSCQYKGATQSIKRALMSFAKRRAWMNWYELER